MKFPQVVVDLLAARDLIATRGLAKRVVEDNRGRMCSRGALGLATGLKPWDWGTIRAKQAEAFLDAIVPAVYIEYAGEDDVVHWNNADERTQADVVDAFDAAASLALSEAAR